MQIISPRRNFLKLASIVIPTTLFGVESKMFGLGLRKDRIPRLTFLRRPLGRRRFCHCTSSFLRTRQHSHGKLFCSSPFSICIALKN